MPSNPSEFMFAVFTLLLFVTGGSLLGYAVMGYLEERAKEAALAAQRKAAADAFTCERQIAELTKKLSKGGLSPAESRRYGALLKRQEKLQESLQDMATA